MPSQRRRRRNRKTKRQRGGALIARGAYGCVWKPALACKNEPLAENTISKLMDDDDATQELNEARVIDKHDPMHLASLPSSSLRICEPERTYDSKDDLENTIHKSVKNRDCSDHVKRVDGKLVVEKDTRLLVQPVLGVDWSNCPEKLSMKTKSSALNHRNCVIFQREMLRVMQFLRQLGKAKNFTERLLHGDIKFTNILIMPFTHGNGDEDQVSTVIDFGFVKSFGKLIKGQRATRLDPREPVPLEYIEDLYEDDLAVSVYYAINNDPGYMYDRMAQNEREWMFNRLAKSQLNLAKEGGVQWDIGKTVTVENMANHVNTLPFMERCINDQGRNDTFMMRRAWNWMNIYNNEDQSSGNEELREMMKPFLDFLESPAEGWIPEDCIRSIFLPVQMRLSGHKTEGEVLLELQETRRKAFPTMPELSAADKERLVSEYGIGGTIGNVAKVSNITIAPIIIGEGGGGGGGDGGGGEISKPPMSEAAAGGAGGLFSPGIAKKKSADTLMVSSSSSSGKKPITPIQKLRYSKRRRRRNLRRNRRTIH